MKQLVLTFSLLGCSMAWAEAVLNVTSQVQTVDGLQNIASKVTLAGKAYNIPVKGSTVTLSAGEYALQPEEKLGYAVQAPATLTLKDGANTLNIVYRPKLSVVFKADRTVVPQGESFILRAEVASELSQYLSGNLEFVLPEGLEAVTSLDAQKIFKQGANAVLETEVYANATGTHRIGFQLSPWDKSGSLNVQVVKAAALALKQTVEPSEAQVGQTVTYTITARNTGDYVLKNLTLNQELPEGLQALTWQEGEGSAVTLKSAIKHSFDLPAGESKVFRWTAKVGEKAPELVASNMLATWQDNKSEVQSLLKVLRAKVSASVSAFPQKALACESVNMTYTIDNEGTAPMPYTLVPQANDMLGFPAQKFEGVLPAGESATHGFQAVMNFGGEARADVLAELTTPQGKETLHQNIERAWLEITVSAPKRVVFSAEGNGIVVQFKNPLDREVALQVQDASDTGLGVQVSQSITVDGYAAREVVLPFVAKAIGAMKYGAQVLCNGRLTSNRPEGTVEVLPVLIPERVSDIAFKLQAVTQAEYLVFSHKLPKDTTYVIGSSRLNGETLADPLLGESGKLYWTLPNTATADFRYQVSHEASLKELESLEALAVLPRNRTEDLQGKVDLAEYKKAKAIEDNRGNAGAIKYPLDGTVFNDRSQITVNVFGAVDEDLQLLVNGELIGVKSIGKRTTDQNSKTQSLEYVAVQLQEGENILQSGKDSIKVYLAGQISQLVFKSEKMIADGSSPVVVRLEAQDAAGKLTGTDFVNVWSDTDIVSPDANPLEAGHQVRVYGGSGLVQLKPQVVPSAVNVTASYGKISTSSRLLVEPTKGSIYVGYASAAYNLSDQLSGTHDPLLLQGAMYGELDVGPGKLYAVANSKGLIKENFTPTDANYSLKGDGSQSTVSLFGIDPVAFSYIHPEFELSYQEQTPEMKTFAVPALTMLEFRSKTPIEIRGFVAGKPEAERSDSLAGNGTRFYHLPYEQIVVGSERIEIVTTDAKTGQIKTVSLKRLNDYVLNYDLGLVELSYPLFSFDDQFNPLSLNVTYRLQNASLNRKWIYGTEANYTSGNVQASLGLVSQNSHLTYSAKVQYKYDKTAATLKTSWDGTGYRVEATANTQIDKVTLNVNSAVQNSGYSGFDKNTAGTSVRVGASYNAGNNLAITSAADYGSAGGVEGAAVDLGIRYKWDSLNLSTALRQGWWSREGLSAIVGAEYSKDNVSVSTGHTQSFGKDQSESQFTVRYGLTPIVSLLFQDQYNWYKASNKGMLGLETKVGNASFSVGYDLPAANGEGNKARFGATTMLPLDKNWSIDIKGSYNQNLAKEGNEVMGSGSVRYQNNGLSGMVGVDSSLRTGVLGTVFKTSLSGVVNDDLTLGTEGAYEISAIGQGSRFGVNYAYRADTLNSLGYMRYQNGILGGNNSALLAKTDVNYIVNSDLQLNAGFATRYVFNDPDAFGVQAKFGLSYFVVPEFGLGINTQSMWFPRIGIADYALGLEGTYRIAQGIALSAGYNFTGFEGIESPDSRKGFYLRLSFLLSSH